MLAHPTPLNIVILAAGSAHRLGRCKPLVRIHGESLLRRTVNLVAHLPGRCFVVMPPNASRFREELRGFEVTFLENPGRSEGIASSVRLAIARAPGAAGVLFLPADLPNLRLQELRRLISVWRGAPRRVVARRIGDQWGTPLILPRWLHCKAMLLRGDVGLRAVLATLPAQALHLVALPSAADDIDTPQELAAARKRFGVRARTRQTRERL
jgi:molybdenum cofactor cytidylyltransferase